MSCMVASMGKEQRWNEAWESGGHQEEVLGSTERSQRGPKTPTKSEIEEQ